MERNVILPADMLSRDANTIQAVLNGNSDRFAELVDAYQGPAIRIAFTFLGNEEEARDAAQEAFIRAYRGLGGFHQEAKFSTWLYRIVVNVCKDAYRRRAHQPVVVARVGAGSGPEEAGTFFVDVDDPSGSPSDAIANSELSSKLTQAIGQLPEKQREAFILRHLHGLSLEEAATIMNCRLGTVKSHVFRAMETLRKQLAPWVQQEGQRG